MKQDEDFWKAYEAGSMGDFPQESYKTTKFTTPQVNVKKWHETCGENGYVLMSPHRTRTADNKVLMLDYRGSLVWYGQEKGSVHNIQV